MKGDDDGRVARGVVGFLEPGWRVAYFYEPVL